MAAFPSFRTLLEVLHISGRQGDADLVVSDLLSLLESGLGGLGDGSHCFCKLQYQRQQMSAFRSHNDSMQRIFLE